MKVTVMESALMADINKLDLTANLLEKCPEPKLKSESGCEVIVKSLHGGALSTLTKDRVMFDRKHVQLECKKLPFTLTYCLNGRWPVQAILISTYVAYQSDYGYGSYEVYLGQEEATLYRPENKIGEFDRTGKFEQQNAKKFAAQIFYLSKGVAANFLGFRFTKGCVLDGVVRLDLVGAFSGATQGQVQGFRKLGVPILNPATATVENGCQTYPFNPKACIDKLVVKNVNEPVFALINGKQVLLPTKNAEPYGEEYLITLPQPVTAEAISTAPNNLVTALITQNTVTVKSKVINPDFLGTGVNVLPTQLMDTSLEMGYDPDFFEKVEKPAILALRPQIARVWFQNDWFQTAPDEYNFELPKFRQFLKYMDVFKQLDTDIELNFTFVVGRNIQPWFSIPGVKDQARSAPRDLKQFARSVAACLKHLWGLGYPVRALTISNEPNNINFDTGKGPEHKKEYYALALREIDAQLRSEGLREKVEIWGAESTSSGHDWPPAMHRLAAGVIDRYTAHNYQSFYQEYEGWLAPQYKKDVDGKSICITEFGTAYPTFKLSSIGTLIAVANCGFDAALEWCLTNSCLPDPMFFPFDEAICLYRNETSNKKYINRLQPQRICNEFGPALRYIKKHSRVLKAEYCNNFDVHIAVFEKDGDYTIIAEAAGSGNRELKIDLSELNLKNKTFQKLHYVIDSDVFPKSLLPVAEPVVLNNNCIVEKLTTAHEMYLFTTLTD